MESLEEDVAFQRKACDTMTRPKISIIVPVFNVGQYLYRCLDSVLNQTFSDFEVILIDDGSTDQSGAICDEYAAHDIRFKVIHKQNEGVSIARNKGIEIAKADWFLFVDSDDELLPNGLDLLFKNAGDDVDLVGASYIRYLDGVLVPDNRECFDALLTREQYIKGLSYSKYRNFERNCWNKLFRRTVMEKNHVTFEGLLVFWEDVLFLYSYLIYCKNPIRCINEPVYVYYRRSDGAAMTYYSKYTPNSKGMFLALEKILQMVKEDKNLCDSEKKIKSDLVSAFFYLRKLINKAKDRELKKEKHLLWKRLRKKLSLYEIVKFRAKRYLSAIIRRIKSWRPKAQTS